MSIGATSASASIEIGNNCQATTAPSNTTLVQLAKGSGGAPLAAPNAGVLTKWTVRLPSVPGTYPQTMKVFRSAGGTHSFQAVAQDTQNVGTGENNFNVRIPVQAGDRLGLYGNTPLGALACITSNPADVLGLFAGEVTLGSTSAFTEAAGAQVAVSGVVEPDVDGDGYGDETQDKCPQSAATQAPCPMVALTSSASAQKGLVKVIVTSSVQTTVTVGGTVKLGKGKTATLSGGTQVVAPGTLAQFTVLFPKALKEKLKSLSRKQSLKLSLTASAPNIVGPPTVSALSIKVKGQKKAKRHHKSKH